MHIIIHIYIYAYYMHVYIYIHHHASHCENMSLLMESLSIYIRLRVRRGLSENVVTKIFGTCLPGHHNLGVHCRSTHLFIDVLARHDLPPPPCVVFIEFPQVLLDGSTWRSEPPQPSNSSTNQTIFRATHIYQLFVGSLRGSNM